MTNPHQQIVVRVALDGTITAETKNITGDKCLDYVAILEDLLDASTSTSRFTNDYQLTTNSTTDEATNDLPQR